MKTRFVLSMFAVGALLATQGLVGCGSDNTSTPKGTGGAKGTGGSTGNGGATSAGGTTSTGGSRAAGGATSNGGITGSGGSTVRRDAGPDTARPDTARNDTARNDTSAACGGEGEACCTNGRACDNGLTCQGTGGNRTCETAPATDGGNRDTFRRDTAEDAPPCGALGEDCCSPGRTCDNGLTCRGGGTGTCRETASDGGGG